MDFSIFLQNTLTDFITAAGVFVLVYAFLGFFKKYLIHILKRLAKKTKNYFDDAFVGMLEHLNWPFILVASIYSGSRFLEMPYVIDKAVAYISLAIAVYYFIKAIFKGIDVFTESVTENGEGSSIVNLMGTLIKIAVVIIMVLVFLSNVGVNVSSLIAGVGLGGIAIAFALQNILSDLFSSFSIYFDKPFKPGDFIIVGQDMGVVQKIGLQSTRIKALQGEELIISNRELTSARVNNYKRMEERRVPFTIGVEYSTPLSKLRKIPKMVRDTVKKQDKARMDRVHFKSFGDFSLIYEIVYYVENSDYTEYMDIQHAINMDLVRKFEKEGIQFAFPTQTIHLKK